jgi:hypothetical protein
MQIRLSSWLPMLVATLVLGSPAARAPPVPPPPWPVTQESPAPAAVDPTRPLLLGALRVGLDSTAVLGLRNAIGAGVITHQGNGTDSLDWLCYTVSDATPAQRIWLASSELARGRIDGVTAIDLPANTPASDACPELPAKFRPVRFEDGLWLGPLTAELRKSLGVPARAGASYATLFHGQSGNLDVVGSITIEFRGGRAVSLHVAHSSQN